MILIKLDGRLGNQMFQMAFGLWLGSMWNTPVAAYDPGRRSMLRRHFRLNLSTRLATLLVDLFPHLWARTEIADLSRDSDCQAFVERVLDGTERSRDLLIEGYFQSFQRFATVEAKVRRAFSLQSNRLLRHTPDLEAAVHVRRGDYAEFISQTSGGKPATLPISYYINAADRLPSGASPLGIVTEDEAQIGDGEFDFLGPHSVISDSAISDFATLMKAKYLVISNSTFAWWAAFLGRSKLVIAPKYWLGFSTRRESPEGIQYDGFSWIDVD